MIEVCPGENSCFLSGGSTHKGSFILICNIVLHQAQVFLTARPWCLYLPSLFNLCVFQFWSGHPEPTYWGVLQSLNSSSTCSCSVCWIPQVVLNVDSGHSVIFPETVPSPCCDFICPTYFVEVWQDWHLSRDSFSPCFPGNLVIKGDIVSLPLSSAKYNYAV